jgi:hypothetical protein
MITVWKTQITYHIWHTRNCKCWEHVIYISQSPLDFSRPSVPNLYFLLVNHIAKLYCEKKVQLNIDRVTILTKQNVAYFSRQNRIAMSRIWWLEAECQEFLLRIRTVGPSRTRIWSGLILCYWKKLEIYQCRTYTFKKISPHVFCSSRVFRFKSRFLLRICHFKR